MYIRPSIVTIDIFYYMPMYTSIIQEFIWQTEDIVPRLPRTHKFLNFWKNNIDATIQEVRVAYTYNKDYRNVILWTTSSC